MAGREPLNEQDFMKMQQDAINRVREMQARARRTLSENGIPLEPAANSTGATGQTPQAGGTQPNARPNVQPGAQPNAQPGAQPNAQPGTPPAAPPSAQPGADAPRRRQAQDGRAAYTPPAYVRQGHTLRPTLRDFTIDPQDDSAVAQEAPRPERDRPDEAEPPRPEPGRPDETDPLRALFHLSIDSEQILLMGILYLLYRDHGDPYLMMALAYLLLG